MIFLILILVLIGSILIALIGGIVTKRYVKTPPFKDSDGNVIPNSIAEFCRVDINGDTHAVLIRGMNLDNPVLLFLHAGPCLSETGLMRNFHPELEEHYTMVYYDMRGSAKSYTPFQNYTETFTTEQLLQDVNQMTTYVKDKLNKEKIALMGHSFGAGFGALAASTYPNDYSIFIGIGQPSNINEQNRVTHAWTLETAKKDNNEKAVVELEKASNYWTLKEQNEYFSKMMIHKKWVAHYGGQIVGKKDFVPFVLSNLLCHEYTIFDYAPYFLGMMAGGPASFDIMISTNLKTQAANFEAPFIFLTGRQDYNLGPAIAQDYYNSINAPLKTMYWFENSAHFPHFEEPELFQKIMIEEILPLIKSGNN